jgi:hypothetical protein
MSDHFKINDGPVACFIGAKGSAFDLPTTKRAYTYAEQPGNVGASKLGRALETAARCSASDSIDAGLVLLKALQAEGFGVFQLGAEYTVPPRQWQTLSDEEIYGSFRKSGLEAYHQRDAVVQYDYDRRINAFARAVEEKLRAKNSTLACIPAVPPG